MSTTTRPNILLITADQWRGDLFSDSPPCPLNTPHLNALATRGTRFARHYCQAIPCGPSRASLFTGLYAHKHRSVVNGMPLDARHPTLFTELRAAGYWPTLFGYTDVTLDPRGKAPLDPDNGEYENLCPGISAGLVLDGHAKWWLAHLKSAGYSVPTISEGRHGIFAQRPFGEPAMFAAEHSETAFLTDRLIDWLGVTDDKPFCAHISYIAPHPPFAAAEPFQSLIDPADVRLPVRGTSIEVEAAQHPLMAEVLNTVNVTSFLPGRVGYAKDCDEATIRQTRAIYGGMAHEVDHHLGRLFAALKALGKADNTIIVFTSDHGEQLYDHWLLGKVGYFDQSTHVPLIVYDPRVTAEGGRGRVVNQFTESVDILPTLLKSVSLTPSRNADGHSLLPFCAGETPNLWRDEAHWAIDFRDIVTNGYERALGLPSAQCHFQVVRTDRLKYVHFADLPPVLFDLQEDPHETINRINDPAAQSLRIEGLERMITWRQRHEEQTLTGYLARAGVQYREGP